MLIKTGRQTELSMKLLCLDEYPFSEKELKSNFKQLIKKFHPDINPSTHAQHLTIDLLKAYKHLKNLASAPDNKIPDDEDDGDLFQLKKTCSKCQGSKLMYKKIKSIIDCPTCDGHGSLRNRVCKKCWGRGYISTFIGKVKKVTCPFCRGVGHIKLNPFNPVIRKGAVLVQK